MGILIENDFSDLKPRINEELTLLFSAAGGTNPYFQYLSVNSASNEVTWNIGDVDCETSGNENELTIHTGSQGTIQSAWLFTIVMNAEPEDKISWESVTTLVRDCDNDCYESVAVQYCTNSQIYAMPEPPVCNPDKEISFRYDVNSTGHLLVLTLNGLNPTTDRFNMMDGVVHIEPDMNGIEDLDFVFGLYPNGPLLDAQIVKNQDGSFDIYFLQNGTIWLPISASHDILALQVLGQYNLSQGGDLICSLTNGRASMNSMGIPQPTCSLVADQTTVSIPGYPACPNNLTIIPSRVVDPYCGIGLEFEIIHKSPTPITLDKLKLHYAVHPQSGNPQPGFITNTLPSCVNCISFSYNPVDEFWNYIYDNQSGNISLNSGSKVLIPFDVNQNCLEYFIVYAEAELPGGVTCALVPNFSQSDWPACDPRIQGKFVLPDANATPVTFAKVVLESMVGGTPSFVDEFNNTCNPEYAFCADASLVPFRLVAVQPSAAAHCGCGVTTYDQVLIQKHILQLQTITSPYILMAADVSNQGGGSASGITGIDVTQHRRCILGQQSNFGAQSRPSWQYYNELFQFSDPSEPWDSDLTNAHIGIVPANGIGDYGVFAAVKTGDVNQTCRCAGFRPEQKKPYWKVDVQGARYVDDRVTLPFYLNAPEDILAFQGGFLFDSEQFRFISIVPNHQLGISEANFGLTAVTNGEIRMSWFPTDAETPLSGASLLFTLELERIVQNIGTDELPVLHSADAVLENLIYKPDGEEIAVMMAPPSADIRALETGQNRIDALVVRPNPAENEADILIYSSIDVDANIQVFNATGSLMIDQRAALPFGESMFRIDVSAWPSGSYWIVLQAGGRRMEKKLVKL